LSESSPHIDVALEHHKNLVSWFLSLLHQESIGGDGLELYESLDECSLDGVDACESTEGIFVDLVHVPVVQKLIYSFFSVQELSCYPVGHLQHDIYISRPNHLLNHLLGYPSLLSSLPRQLLPQTSHYSIVEHSIVERSEEIRLLKQHHSGF
jgi:hypothetical protein